MGFLFHRRQRKLECVEGCRDRTQDSCGIGCQTRYSFSDTSHPQKLCMFGYLPPFIRPDTTWHRHCQLSFFIQICVTKTAMLYNFIRYVYGILYWIHFIFANLCRFVTNEKQGGSGRWQVIDIGLEPWWCSFLFLFGRILGISIFSFPLNPAQ